MNTNVEVIVEKLVELEDKVNKLKEDKKKFDDDIKELEEGLIEYCQDNNTTIDTATNGQYNVKPSVGRRLKRK
jgi:hypothetical protein